MGCGVGRWRRRRLVAGPCRSETSGGAEVEQSLDLLDLALLGVRPHFLEGAAGGDGEAVTDGRVEDVEEFL